MKILVYFQPPFKFDNFEGMRLRKSIKGSLELNDVSYTSNVLDKYDVAHFISLDDEAKVVDAREENKPVVISAFMTECDPHACQCELRKDLVYLLPKAIRTFNKASLILVPSKEAQEFLVNNEVTTPSEIAIPGVRISRFDSLSDIEKDLVYRYFKIEKGSQIVLGFGDPLDVSGYSNINEIARNLPSVNFIFFGPKRKWLSIPKKVRKLLRHPPINLMYSGIITDDVYRSALVNAKAIYFGGKSPIGAVTCLDAMASKTQIFCSPKPFLKDILVNGETAYVEDNGEKLAGLLDNFLLGKLKPTTEEAYKIASEHTLEVMGKQLIKVYKSLLEEGNKND